MSERVLNLSEIRVSVAVGAAFIVQIALGLMWSGAAAERLAQIEQREAASSEIAIRTARLEEQVAAIRAQLIRIETKIDREGGEK